MFEAFVLRGVVATQPMRFPFEAKRELKSLHVLRWVKSWHSLNRSQWQHTVVRFAPAKQDAHWHQPYARLQR